MHTQASPRPPADLVRQIRDDPWHAPETIALAAAEYHAPAAQAWLTELQGRYAYEGPQLARMATTKHATWARLGGVTLGLGGLLTMLPNIAALAWIQSRLVFFIAAAYGFDPHDPMRPAELLVLQQLYSDPAAARRALDGDGPAIAETFVGRSLSSDQAAAERLARMLGAKTGKRLAGKAIPGFGAFFNAYANEKETRAIANRAMEFYGG